MHGSGSKFSSRSAEFRYETMKFLVSRLIKDAAFDHTDSAVVLVSFALLDANLFVDS
jgi:hypothetical protein